MRANQRSLVTAVLAVAVMAAACSDDSMPDAGPDDMEPTTSVGSPAGRGWLDGDDLDWHEPELADDETAELTAAPFELPAELESDVARSTPSDRDAGTEEGSEGSDPVAPPEPVELHAGSIDDGADFASYRAYRAAIDASGVPVRSFSVEDPTVIAVLGSNGLPVLDAVVEVAARNQQGQTETRATLRTTASGTTRFLPDAYGSGDATHGEETFEVVVRVGESSATSTFTRGAESVEISVDAPGGVEGSVALDVHFLLDTTGSMDDEIDRLRSNMATIAEQIDTLPSNPDVRFGMTAYRDQGDLFVSRTFDLTHDLGAFQDGLADVVADGGGDYPEALDEALVDALELPAWRADGAVELVILIADAPPQIGRDVPTPYTASALAALERGIKILPVAASGTDDQAEYVFRELAFVTGGRFVFLSYGADGSGGTATGSGTDITPADYDQLPLDQLVVRLVEDEILALTGSQPTPVASTTTTTVPSTTTQ